jgi:deoxycytidylate deaminase
LNSTIILLITELTLTKSFLKKEILNQAIAVAMASDAPKKMGAILLRKRKILSAATNSYVKTSPIQAMAARNASKIWGKGYEKKIYLHSEISVIIKNKTNNDADTIVVCRVGGHGSKCGKNYELRESFPCNICFNFIKEKTNIKHIHYSTDEGFMYEYIGD